jgi:hypothetical protein
VRGGTLLPSKGRVVVLEVVVLGLEVPRWRWLCGATLLKRNVDFFRGMEYLVARGLLPVLDWT